VFLDYELAAGVRSSSFGCAGDALTFTLGGLSKLAGLPQMKLAWLSVNGPSHLVSEALTRLEVICDTYLSVATPVQLAAGHLIEHGAAVRQQILARVRSNLGRLQERAAGCASCSVLRAEGGWYGVVQVPATVPEDDLVVTLLERDSVLVHPGYFFDFAREAFLVVSLLPETRTFDQGVDRLFRRVTLL
jgi:aspartate/methionine/tyrosine aminotransferase